MMGGANLSLHIEELPWDMAMKSDRAARARSYIFEQVSSIDDEGMRHQVQDMLLDVDGRPARLTSEGELATQNHRWVDKLRLPLPYDPTWAAPGGSFGSHHGYPGGWAIHTALNVQVMLQMVEQAEHIKGVKADRDAMIAAMTLHDWAKLKLLQWNEDHTMDADEGHGHHPLVIAECMVRGFSPRVIHLLAGVHGGWWVKPESVENDIRQAAQWIGVDPESQGYIVPSGRHTTETWIMRQAERAWYGMTRETVQRVRDIVGAWREDRGVPYSIEQVQNALYCHWDELQLNQTIAEQDVGHVFSELDTWYQKVNP